MQQLKGVKRLRFNCMVYNDFGDTTHSYSWCLQLNYTDLKI